MTHTEARFKETKARFAAGLFLSFARNATSTFQVQLQISEPKLELFSAAYTLGITGKRPSGRAGPFPESSLLSSALASKDQGGSPDHASRLFALGSIREVGQMLCPSRDRGRRHPS